MNDGQKPNAEISIFQDVGIDMAVCVTDFNFYVDDFDVIVSKSINQSLEFNTTVNYAVIVKNVFKPNDVGKIQNNSYKYLKNRSKPISNYNTINKQLFTRFSYRRARDGLSCNC